jgi:hypothetical protein
LLWLPSAFFTQKYSTDYYMEEGKGEDGVRWGEGGAQTNHWRLS